MKRTVVSVVSALFGACLIAAGPAPAQDVTQVIQQKVAALKQSLAENQKALRHYSWIQNTQLILKGEVKNTKIEQCSYGPDGNVQKTQLSAPPEQKKKRGLKGKIVAKKTEEMKDYMERSIALIERYVPPSPDKMQAVVAAGKAALSQAGPGAIQLQFKDYAKSGDALIFTLDAGARMIRQVKVDSWLDDEADKVSLTVDFQSLPDGTNYAAGKTLDVTAKEIVVKILSNNFQKLAK